MSFNSLERSNHSAKPVALYEFNLGTTTWRYCAAEVMQSYDSGDYEPLVVKDEGISFSGNPENEDVKVTVPRSTPVAGLFAVTPPSEAVFVTIRRANRGASDAPVIWVGTIKAASITGLDQIQFTCLMLVASFQRQGVRLGWQRSCPYALYDRNCKVNPANYATPITLTAVDGATISSTEMIQQQNDRFSGGYIEWKNDYGAMERRGIELHALGNLVLLEQTDGLKVGDRVTAYPGCARTVEACKSFNNFPAHYGGFPAMPGKSPFDGTPVF